MRAVSPPAKLRCVLIGDGSLLVECGTHLLARGHHIEVVVTTNDSIVDWVREIGAERVVPGRSLVDCLAGRTFDWVFSIANLSLVPAAVWRPGALAAQSALHRDRWLQRAAAHGGCRHGAQVEAPPACHAIGAGGDRPSALQAQRLPAPLGPQPHLPHTVFPARAQQCDRPLLRVSLAGCHHMSVTGEAYLGPVVH